MESDGMESHDLEQGNARSWLLRALETERGAVEVYLAAMRASSSPREHDEWRTLLDHARKHEQMLTRACRTLGIDPDEPTAGRDMIGSLAASLVESIELAVASGDRRLVRRTVPQCVVLSAAWARTFWGPIALPARPCRPGLASLLASMHDEVASGHAHHLNRALRWWKRSWKACSRTDREALATHAAPVARLPLQSIEAPEPAVTPRSPTLPTQILPVPTAGRMNAPG